MSSNLQAHYLAKRFDAMGQRTDIAGDMAKAAFMLTKQFPQSSNEMMLSIAAEQTLYAFADGPPTMPLVQGGKIRAIGVTGALVVADDWFAQTLEGDESVVIEIPSPPLFR